MNPFSRVTNKVKTYFQKQKGRKKAQAISEKCSPLKLEIGSGPRKGSNGWITLDYCSRCDITWDLREDLPFQDCSVDAIYASHVLEHFYIDDLFRLLNECRRVMVVGGQISIAVPNARLYVTAYLEGIGFPPQEKIWSPGMPQTNSAIDILNYMAYMGGHHKYMFDEQGLINLLSKCGFRECLTREFDPDLDMPQRHFETIYAKAFK